MVGNKQQVDHNYGLLAFQVEPRVQGRVGGGLFRYFQGIPMGVMDLLRRSTQTAWSLQSMGLILGLEVGADILQKKCYLHEKQNNCRA